MNDIITTKKNTLEELLANNRIIENTLEELLENNRIIESSSSKELLEDNGIIERLTSFCEERYYIITNDVQSDDATVFKGFGNIFEELSEGMKGSHSEHETIDHLVDMIIFSISTLVQMNVNPAGSILTFLIKEGMPYGYSSTHVATVKYEILSKMLSMFICGANAKDSSFDNIKELYISLILTNIQEIENRGYSAKDVLVEALLEISSREQCPNQIKRGRVLGEKWEKNKNQDPKTLYKASYTRLTKQEAM